ncbi:hypothetical protein NCCP2222_20420 [Sporosarcina sp. NCCP-2222]|uniref:hypothetical protein n=1 Tax=Sporosarcina sp. NCCP-2222 TaxID=2935073 RepID=UPI002088AE0D|nr:hypothetical protein [Sporosarcina sp. NCCP-2222]GKV56095.1 hypothetical protein NCCP2222_20420 [Sporosarcina sp. NCCP-2222]
MRAIQQEYGIGAEFNEKFPEYLTLEKTRYTERDMDRLERELTARFYSASISNEDDLLFLAMKAMQQEQVDRIGKVVETYWALSNGFITLSEELVSALCGTVTPLENEKKRWSVSNQHVTGLLKEGIPFTASLPDLFLERVLECGSWEMFSKGVVETRGVSAIGLMKELLGQQIKSRQPDFFFEDQVDPVLPKKILSAGSTLHVERIRQRNRINQIVAIQVRLVNNILSYLDDGAAWIAPITFELPAAYKVIDLYHLQMHAWKNGARLTVCI